MKETLRLHTALPLLVPRSPNQSCIVGEYTIPEGTKLLLNVWAMHREPKVWDNPSEFRPEKFLGKIDDFPQINQSMGIKTNVEKLNQQQHKNFYMVPSM
ncbi:hypothetical protein ACSBR1_041512 [Camellia fascicularis]